MVDVDEDVSLPGAGRPAAEVRPAESKAPSQRQPEKAKLTPLQATLELARRGNQAILPQLREMLDESPELWKHFGDLAGAVERSWISLIAGKDLLMVESITRRLEALRQELGGANRLEKLIVGRIVSAWLQVQYAEAAVTAGTSDGLKLRQFHVKQLESAERRLQGANRNLALVRRLLGGVELHVTHQHHIAGIQSPGEATSNTGKSPAAAGGATNRFSGMFGEGALGPVAGDLQECKV